MGDTMLYAMYSLLCFVIIMNLTCFFCHPYFMILREQKKLLKMKYQFTRSRISIFFVLSVFLCILLIVIIILNVI